MKAQFLHAKLLAYRLGIAMALFSCCRLLFYLANRHLFPKTDWLELAGIFIAGLRFDLSAVIYINCLFILGHILPFQFRATNWFQQIMRVVFFVFNGLVILLEISDVEYYQVVMKRTTINLMDQTSDAINILPQIIVDFWYFLLFYFVIIAVAFYLYSKTMGMVKVVKLNYVVQIPLVLCLVVLSILAARGGWQLIPLMPVTAGQYVKDVGLVPLVNNTALTMLFSFQQRQIKEFDYFPIEEMDQRFHLKRKDASPGPVNKENIMIIMMESHGKNMISRFNEEEGSLPFLDSLIGEGLLSQHTFANGRQSNQGVVSVITGIPSLMEDPVMISQFQDNRMDGLGSLLKKIGYSTHFFHGGNNGTFNIDRFSSFVGFDHYYGRNEYNNDNDFDGNWGIYDYPFFRNTVKELSKVEEPFCSVLFSLSSHHPFTVEPWFKEKYPKMKKLPRSFLYSDYALRQFFEDAKREPWFENTLFIILADHVGYILEEKYKTRAGMYEIPILFYKPDGSLKRTTDNTIQQIDILPSVLDYVNYPKPFHSFGHSVFEQDKYPYTCMFVNNIYQILDKEYILLFDGNIPLGLYNYQKDELMVENILTKAPVVAKRLERELKSILQRHHHAMIYNQLTE